MRRKGELSRLERDRRWPWQVALKQLPEHDKQYARNIQIGSFCDAAGDEAAPRGYSIMHQDEWWEVWCFASAEAAAGFLEKFGGRRFNPRAKARGPGWPLRGDFKRD